MRITQAMMSNIFVSNLRKQTEAMLQRQEQIATQKRINRPSDDPSGMGRVLAGRSTLATIGSTSPYVGLFGTVWGIMSAFQGLGNVQQATLAMVAPGIAEALIATAMGLFAAIPAVVAYNRYADQVGRLELRYDAFMEEFSTILQRHAGSQG